MKLIDWLRKLGILRSGAEASVYHDATDRPLSLQMDGVFDSEKDVFHVGASERTGKGTDDPSTP